ncbi:hypothetical protein, partial [Komagataeibacter xylinus]|uniref:hypothetical protein n=1 Tax=Komagataeibacter xylinus TaxID=28448 RepID=UPI0039E8DFD0
KTLFNIKETRLLHIAIPSINAEEIESYRRPQNQGVFRTLQMVNLREPTIVFQDHIMKAGCA